MYEERGAKQMRKVTIREDGIIGLTASRERVSLATRQGQHGFCRGHIRDAALTF